jgi:YVTN family beta-propeller protein
VTNDNYEVINLSVGKYPKAICTSGEKVFVANWETNTLPPIIRGSVSIIDVAGGSDEIVNVPVGRRPSSICTDGEKAFVANYLSKSVSILEVRDNDEVVVTTVEVGNMPCAICTVKEKVFVANKVSNTVSIIDLEDSNRVTTVAVGESPCAICTGGRKVFVANEKSATVSILEIKDNNEVSVTTVAVGNGPQAICTSGNKIFVSNRFSGSVSILADTSGSQGFIFSPSAPESFSYPNPFNPECWIPVGRMEEERCRPKVKIYNILGQLVREIECPRVQGLKDSRVYWDGRDSRGLEVPSGVYFYEMAGKGVRKMVVLK